MKKTMVVTLLLVGWALGSFTAFSADTNAPAADIQCVQATGRNGSGQTFDQTTNDISVVTNTGAPGTWQFSAVKAGYQTNSWTRPITVSKSVCNVCKTGMPSSSVARANSTIVKATAAMPTFSPGSGCYTGSVSAAIACATSGATIRYTTNCTDPTSSSSVYTGPIALSATTTLKAKAFKSGMADSAVNSATYTVTKATVATPTFSPVAPKTFAVKIQVGISCTTSGATIRYTTNGSDPTLLSPGVGFGSVTVTLTSTTTLRAKAFKTGMADSTVASATYTLVADAAISWAEAEMRRNLNGWSGRCYSFVYAAFHQGAGVTDAKLPPASWGGAQAGAVDAAHWFQQRGLLQKGCVPPRGAVVFYDGTFACRDSQGNLKVWPAGHAAISLGGGTVIHAYGAIREGDSFLNLPFGSNSSTAYMGYVVSHLQP